MLRSDNWLETYQNTVLSSLLHLEAGSQDELQRLATEAQQERQALLASVATVEKFFDGKKPKGNMAWDARLFGFPRGRPVLLSGEDLRRAERVATRLFTARGNGRTDAEEALLGHIALCADPTSLPFFQAAIAASRPHDLFAPKRRRMALAAIAFLAAVREHPEAHAVLKSYLDHPDPAIRGEAVEHFAQIHQTKQGKLKVAAASIVARIAREDRAFGPRFLARLWLARGGHEVPLLHPQGVYAFRATLDRTSCTVEMAATHGLSQLAGAIISGFGWDHDHLYEFAMTGDLRERRFILPPDEEHGLPLEFARPTRKREASALDLPIGALGLTKDHRFLFHYDFGDSHRFQVVLTAIHPQREPRARYPRVVARTGKRIEQYPRW